MGKPRGRSRTRGTGALCASRARYASGKCALSAIFVRALRLPTAPKQCTLVRMTYVHKIISQFGGVRATAAALGLPPSTVQGWKNRGTIPDGKKPDVLAAAIRTGLSITQADFWPGQR